MYEEVRFLMHAAPEFCLSVHYVTISYQVVASLLQATVINPTKGPYLNGHCASTD
jgi:biotin transporter BioY